MLVMDPWQRAAATVAQRYMSNAEQLGQLMERLGADQVEVNGDSVRCTCPIHQGDNRRSFGIWVDRGHVACKCFTRCGTFSLPKLVMRKYQCSYQQAVTFLGQFVGFDVQGQGLVVTSEQLHEEGLDMLRRRIGAKKQQVKIFDESWVQQAINYWSHPNGLLAWDFLTGPLDTRMDCGEKRKQFDRETLRQFEVGFVPACAWLLPHPKEQGKKVGWFDDRICIPWRDWDGRCIGFAGRRFDGVDFCKYQTFHDTRKSVTWYGLHNQRVKDEIRRSRRVVIVEGYGDVWRAWSHGVYNVISPGGTDLSREQINLLHRLGVEEVIFYFDSDEAGVLSSSRMADQLREAFKIRIGFPPQGFDPGDLLTRESYLAGVNQSKLFL